MRLEKLLAMAMSQPPVGSLYILHHIIIVCGRQSCLSSAKAWSHDEA